MNYNDIKITTTSDTYDGLYCTINKIPLTSMEDRFVNRFEELEKKVVELYYPLRSK